MLFRVSVAPLAYRWSQSEFVRAWEAGALDHRVELVNGEVWPAVVGTWHGVTVGQVIGMLPREGVPITTETLPTGDSLPDPDCWVQRAGSSPTGKIGVRLSRWDPNDVLLVVEVSDETIPADLEIKAKLYGTAGYSLYWVVTPEAIYEHTQPMAGGYRTRTAYKLSERIPVGYADTDLGVSDLVQRD
jgi:hypothetical protein